MFLKFVQTSLLNRVLHVRTCLRAHRHACLLGRWKPCPPLPPPVKYRINTKMHSRGKVIFSFFKKQYYYYMHFFINNQGRRQRKGGGHGFHFFSKQKEKRGKKERVPRQKPLKGCYQGLNVSVLAILERLEFRGPSIFKSILPALTTLISNTWLRFNPK